MNKLFIDIETNGLPQRIGYNKYYQPNEITYYDSSRIIEIAYVIYDDNKNKIKKISHLIKNNDIVINNTNIHGITLNKTNKKGISIIDVINELDDNLINVNLIVSHNILFDINILLSECYRINNLNIINKINIINKMCTMELGQQIMRVNKSPKLSELYYFLFRQEHETRHRALSDVKICYKCFYKIEQLKKID